MNQIDIILWMKCNEKCGFCFQNTNYIKKFDKKTVLKTFLKILLKWKIAWYESVNISWWEPTIYPEFNQVLRLANKLDFRNIKVTTNWLKFADTVFAEENLKYITSVCLSFHSSEENIQDKLTWTPWSLNKVNLAIENIRKYKNIKLDNHLVITNDNIWYLDNHIENIIKLEFSSIHLMPLMKNIESESQKSYKNEEISKILIWIIDKFSNKIKLEISYFQPCLIPWYEKYVLWFDYWKKYISNNEESLMAWEETMKETRYFKEDCEKCSFKEKCLGFSKI